MTRSDERLPMQTRHGEREREKERKKERERERELLDGLCLLRLESLLYSKT